MPARPAAPVGRAAAAGRQRRGFSIFSLPLKLLATGLGVMASVVQLTCSVAAYVGDRVLPASVMRAARGRFCQNAGIAAVTELSLPGPIYPTMC